MKFFFIYIIFSVFITLPIDGMFSFWIDHQNKINQTQQLKNKAIQLGEKNQTNLPLQNYLKFLNQTEIDVHNCNQVQSDLQTLLFIGNTYPFARLKKSISTNIPSFSIRDPFAKPKAKFRNISKEILEIISDTKDSLRFSDTLIVGCGLIIADSLVRRNSDNIALTLLAMPLYVIVPLTAVCLKKCTWDMNSILLKNNDYLATCNNQLYTNNQNLEQQHNSMIEEQNRIILVNQTLEEVEKQLKQEKNVLQQEKNVLQTKLTKIEISHTIEAFILKNQSKKNIKSALDSQQKSFDGKIKSLQVVIDELKKKDSLSFLDGHKDLDKKNNLNEINHEIDEVPSLLQYQSQSEFCCDKHLSNLEKINNVNCITKKIELNSNNQIEKTFPNIPKSNFQSIVYPNFPLNLSKIKTTNNIPQGSSYQQSIFNFNGFSNQGSKLKKILNNL